MQLGTDCNPYFSIHPRVSDAGLRHLWQPGRAESFAVIRAMAILGYMFIRKFAPEMKGRQLEETQHFRENGGTQPIYKVRNRLTSETPGAGTSR
jgi:hypothetical protein